MELGLRGRVAVVTGGAAGIGAVITSTLAGEGVSVWIADRDGAAADLTSADLRTRGLQVRSVRVDVTNVGQVLDAMQHVKAHDGRLDVLVCNAGILTTGAFGGSSGADWDAAVAVNLSGVVNCVRAAIPIMTEQGSGRVVNVASVSAMRGGGSIGNVIYGTTKAGVVALTMGLARELGPAGITVNAVAPAVAETPMTKASLSPELADRIKLRIPLRRLCSPADIADAVAFLVSDRASFINGAVLPIDGGLLTT